MRFTDKVRVYSSRFEIDCYFLMYFICCEIFLFVIRLFSRHISIIFNLFRHFAKCSQLFSTFYLQYRNVLPNCPFHTCLLLYIRSNSLTCWIHQTFIGQMYPISLIRMLVNFVTIPLPKMIQSKSVSSKPIPRCIAIKRWNL